MIKGRSGDLYENFVVFWSRIGDVDEFEAARLLIGDGGVEGGERTGSRLGRVCLRFVGW